MTFPSTCSLLKCVQLLSEAHQQRAGQEVAHPGEVLAPIWDAGGFAC